MTDTCNIQDWKIAAALAAERFQAAVADTDLSALTLHSVPVSAANGTNSFDMSFLESLENGDHLDANFLANA